MILLLGALALSIAERPLPWTAARQELTLAYLREHTDPAAQSVEMVPQVVVLHWTAGPTAESAYQTFAPATLAGRPELQRGGALNVGAHFVVDRDGAITRLAPETRVLRHCIGLNHVAIGVENVGGGPGLPLTAAQVEADAALVRDLAGRFPITLLIGHHEATRLRGDPLYVERMAGYTNEKADPGDAFMVAVREKVADLGLRGPPAQPPPTRKETPRPFSTP